jgi:triacylglycerol lipase
VSGFFQKWKSWLVVAGAFVLAVVVIAVSPPGCEQTDKEPIHPDGPPKPPISSLERLRSSWDSEGEAVWPVTELLASMSETAYQSPPAAKMSYGKLGFDQIVPVLADSLTAFVASGEDVTVIAFRGTDNPADWLVNLDVIPIQTPHGEMHQGFADAYKKMKAPILDVLRPKPPKHLWVTGHSLGGALAVVCAYDLIDNEKMALDGVITFGQPMLARKGLADYLDKLMLGRFAHLVRA